MKKVLILLLAIPGCIYAGNSIFDNHTWFLDSNTLSTSIHKSYSYSGQNYDHTLVYVTPSGEHGKSDLCSVTSSTTLSCVDGDSVTYQAAMYSATLKSKYMGTYTYYEKGHLPSGSPLSGNWHREQNSLSNCRNSDLVSFTIPYHDSNAKTFTNIDRYFSDGFSKDDVMYLVKDNTTGRLALSSERVSNYFSYFLYDADNNPIYDFDRINTLAKLNDADRSADPQCNLTKVK